GGRLRVHRDRPFRQPEPRETFPLALRADPRLGSRHCGSGHREPVRGDLGGGPPPRTRRARRSRTTHPRRARSRHRGRHEDTRPRGRRDDGRDDRSGDRGTPRVPL
ncbi:MAG: D-malate dehydrogenase [decarboxylating], partial [uncultured Rubrobacteraceae bacterium]